MKALRLADYLSHIVKASQNACAFVESYDQEDFLRDQRTQQAVVFSFIVIGEATRSILTLAPDFAKVHPEINWYGMMGMRNRIAHGYFEVDYRIVWETVQVELPNLINLISPLIQETHADQS